MPSWTKVTLILGLIPLQVNASDGSIETPRDVIERMLSAQSNLKGFSAQGLVELTIGKVQLPSIKIKMTVKRPSSIDMSFLSFTVKPKTPIMPDPESLTSRDYNLKWTNDNPKSEDDKGISYWSISATPTSYCDSPYSMKLLIDPETWLLTKVVLTQTGKPSTTVNAEYKKMGPGCWVPVSLEGFGSQLIKDMFPLPPVVTILRAMKHPDSIAFHVTLSEFTIIN